ncbi:MAG TPA: L-aspartate oxidase [Alphaproteobacteria bacterium]|jgi:L-aspartate oxidase
MATYDVLIIGSGAGGLGAALALPSHLSVAVVSKGRLAQGATNWAQGGIATVLGADDSFDLHVEDTLAAGAGLCHPDAVRFVVERAPAVIDRLASYGIELTEDETTLPNGLHYHLTREGGHSRRRIVHAADATGRAVQLCLQEELARRGNVATLENTVALDLIVDRHAPGGPRCVGAWLLDRDSGRVVPALARTVVLASGGASSVYLHATNPEGATGDGIAMAWRAGCRVANMEFVQFHPTCLYHPGGKPFLITEAMRGEGGQLRLRGATRANDTRFMVGQHPLAELAPRDIVARAIHHEMAAHGLTHVDLDISHKPATFIEEHFPTIAAHCRAIGLDIAREPIPVVPAAHYTCGGIVTDLAARSDLAGLYAVGECAFSGLHGANRMASNSLLECLVFADAAAQDIVARFDAAFVPLVPVGEAPPGGNAAPPSAETIAAWTETIRRVMWDEAGIVRSVEGMQAAQRELAPVAQAARVAALASRPQPALIEAGNLAAIAEMVLRSALLRRESRGGHYVVDFPALDATRPPTDTVISFAA